jgi:hypothetical protein
LVLHRQFLRAKKTLLGVFRSLELQIQVAELVLGPLVGQDLLIAGHFAELRLYHGFHLLQRDPFLQAADKDVVVVVKPSDVDLFPGKLELFLGGDGVGVLGGHHEEGLVAVFFFA